MSEIANSILALFLVISTGWVAKRIGLLPDTIIGPLNRLVFYLALPALIFEKISRASFHHYFDLLLIVGALVAAVMAFFLAWAIGRILGAEGGRLGTFIQSCIHGNLGYMGLAVSYYFLGEEGFTRASLLASFLILLQNLLAIAALQLCSSAKGKGARLLTMAGHLLVNPIILGAAAGLLVSAWELEIPKVVQGGLGILSHMALPTGLLLIGASLSLNLSWSHLKLILGVSVVKLIMLPGLGFLLYTGLSVARQEMAPGIILLAAPTATVTYVMSREMGGSASLASSTISATTLLSGLGYLVWLSFLS